MFLCSHSFALGSFISCLRPRSSFSPLDNYLLVGYTVYFFVQNIVCLFGYSRCFYPGSIFGLLPYCGYSSYCVLLYARPAVFFCVCGCLLHPSARTYGPHYGGFNSVAGRFTILWPLSGAVMADFSLFTVPLYCTVLMRDDVICLTLVWRADAQGTVCLRHLCRLWAHRYILHRNSHLRCNTGR